MARYTNDRPPTGVGVQTLAAGYYRSPDYFSREQQTIFRTMWLFAGRADDVPAPGHYVTRRYGDTRVLLVRGDDGRVRAFYHAWTYRLDGTLLKAPSWTRSQAFARTTGPSCRSRSMTGTGTLRLSRRRPADAHDLPGRRRHALRPVADGRPSDRGDSTL